jgi:hypothetical protein
MFVFMRLLVLLFMLWDCVMVSSASMVWVFILLHSHSLAQYEHGERD